MALSYTIVVNDQGAKVFDNTKKKINEVEKSANAASSSMEKMSKAVAALAGLSVLDKFVAGYEEQERATKRLEQASINAGDAFGYSKKKAEELTASLMSKTNYADEQQMASLAKLTTMLGSFDAATAALPNVLNLAAYAEEDLTAATEQYGKAAQGNMRLLGTQFSALKNLKDAGASTSEVMKRLNEMIAGQAEIDVSTLQQFKNNIGEAGDMIGKTFMPALEGINFIFKEMPSSIQAITVALPLLAGAFAVLGGPLTIAVGALGAAGFLVNKISDNIKNSSMETEKYAESIKTVSQAMEGLAHVEEALPGARSQASSLMGSVSRTQKWSESANEGQGGFVSPFDDELKQVQSRISQMEKARDKYRSLIGELAPTKKPNVKAAELGREVWFDRSADSSNLPKDFSAWANFHEGIATLEDEQSNKSKNELEAYNTFRIDSMKEGQDKELAIFEQGFEEKFGAMVAAGMMETELTQYHQQARAEIIDKYIKLEKEKNAERVSSAMWAAGSIMGALAGLNSALKGNARVTQGLLIGETIMNTSAAIMKFMVTPGGPLGWGMSIAAGITGAAQIANIASQKFANGGWVSGSGNTRSDNIPTMLSPSERVVSAREIDAVGGRDAFDRSIRASMRNGDKKTVQVVLSGPVDRSYLREVFIPELQTEMDR